jgi:hypothetical protein
MSDEDRDRPIVRLPIEPPPLSTLLRDETRGGAVDQKNADIATAAPGVPALPGGAAMAENAAYRQKLIAGIGSMRSQGVNQFASGAVTGLVVAAGLVAFVTVGVEGAVVVGGVALVARFLGGRT